MDDIEAYLESLMGDNKLPIFIKLPPGMRDLRFIRKTLMCKLLRSIYGLKQSGRLWNQKVIGLWKTLGFNLLNTDPSIQILTKIGGEILMISVYVDDFFLTSNNSKTLQWLKNTITKKYNMKNLGEVSNNQRPGSWNLED